MRARQAGKFDFVCTQRRGRIKVDMGWTCVPLPQIPVPPNEPAPPPSPPPPPPPPPAPRRDPRPGVLMSLHDGCDSVHRARSPDCVAAIHRYCTGAHGGAGLSQEIPTAHTLQVACLSTTFYGDVSVDDLRVHHAGCNLRGSQESDCVAAMHRWCIHNGKGGAGIAQEVGNGVFGVACFAPEWFGDVSVEQLRSIHPGCNAAQVRAHTRPTPGSTPPTNAFVRRALTAWRLFTGSALRAVPEVALPRRSARVSSAWRASNRRGTATSASPSSTIASSERARLTCRIGCESPLLLTASAGKIE